MPDFALRIADASKGSGEFRVELSFDNGLLVRTSATEFNFSVSARDQELVRWYWEDFVEYPDRVAQRKAARVEQRLREIGDELFRQVFDPPAARQFWSEIQPRLGETRIEILGSQRADFTLLPWEFLRDPKTGALLAEGCASFVRRSKATRLSSRDWSSQPGPLRVLLVMWQPPADPRLPFRPTARRLLQALSREARGTVSVDILRPPTYGQLNTVLLEAEAVDQPYHVLQFDGYGIFTDAAEEGGGAETHSLHPPRGPRGYLISDNSTWERTRQLLDGGALGDLMIEARVPWLVLNACRGSGTSKVDDAERDDVAQPGCLRAFHSLALDALEKGIAGVLQLPYHLGSAASAQFLLKTYLKLAQGRSLAEAATQHRKWLREQAERQPKGLPFLGWDLAEKKWQRSQPESELTFGWVRREDWLVPVIYEPLAFRLEARPEPENAAAATQAEAADTTESAELEIGDSQLPSHDAPGFFGRDDILLAIDSLWQRHSVVLLHGDAATGKTETAVEFARWYREVGGVRSTVLYTSFEHYKPVAALLDQLATVFAPVLRKAGQPWESLDLENRMEIALELLNQAPVLWIWDGVEHLAESAAGAAWSAQEQEEFANFLRAAHETQAKFLLVSRHEEKQWLRDLPVRFGIPPLPIRERLQLTRALMEQHGLRLKNVEDWHAVFEFSEGNPLAIRFLVEQALAENLRTRGAIDQFVARVRQSAPQSPQAGGAGLAEPLQVTLRYIQHNAFNEGERKILALLRLFPGRVSADLLAAMGGAGEKTWLPELQEIREFQELRAGSGPSVLDRAASVGLLHTEGENRYTTHPALQWFFQELFEECYPVAVRSPKSAQRGSLSLTAPPESKAPPPAPKKERESGWDAAGKSLMGALGQWSSRGAFLGFGGSREEGPAARAGRAYVEVIGAFATACAKRAEAGDAAALRELNAQESNLHHACRLACQLEWWSMAGKATRGLGVLYESGGRLAQWEALLEQLTPLCVQRFTQESLPGREEFWRVVIGQGAKLAHKNRKLTRAEKLQELCVRWDRQKAGSRDEKAGSRDEIAIPSEDDDRETQRSLAGSLYSLSTILREQGTPSVKVDEEAVELRERLGEKKPASAWAYEIGHSYTEAPEIRELSQAERWLKRGLELISEDDRPGKAKCLAQLGRVAWVRFNEARRGDRPEAELRRYLNDARMYYQAALEYDPPDDFPKLAQHHEELGHISQAVGDFERAFPHYREAIRYHDLSEDLRSAGHTRFNLAIDLRNANRLAEARKYALAARENLERVGASEHDIMSRIKMLLENIEQKLQAKRGLQ